MIYAYIQTVVAICAAILLIVYRKKIAAFQKKKAQEKKGLVDARLNELSQEHLEKVAIFGACVLFGVAIISLIEIMS